MKAQTKITVWASALSFVFTACQKQTQQELQTQDAITKNADGPSAKHNGDDDNGNHHVYTLTNGTGGNRVMEYNRSANGSISFNAAYPTGGTGTGGGLGNQGAVILSEEGKWLIAVNAGSNSVASFKVNNNGLEHKSTVSSGGMRPVSVTQYHNLVFVLNAGGTNNISGFTISESGMLHAIANSTRPLTTASTGPAQISFVQEGRVLVITEKATNKIVTYTVNENGIPGAMTATTSSSPTPFGFAVGKHNNIFVSEAVGGAPGASVLSSYNVSSGGALTLLNGSVGAGQSAACWVVITNNQKYAFTTNTASDNLTTFGINNWGGISVEEAISATTQAGPIDAALSNNSKFLYVLNGAAHSIQGFSVGSNGGLILLQTQPGVPVGATGLAAN